MKKIYVVIILNLFVVFNSIGQSTNGFCNTSDQFCTGTTYNFPAGVNTNSAEVGPNYMCLFSQPNPAWYYLVVDQPGDISIDIHTVPQHDVDFICWGPFVNPTNPCQNSLTGIGSPGSHWAASNPHPANMGGYPAGNTIDCSYNSSWQEWCYIPNAQAGEYYIFMITNYSNQTCNIILNQVNTGQPGAGSTVCGYMGVVHGKVFLDENYNSIQDSSEVGLTQTFVGSTSCVFQSLTDDSGNYNGYICALPDSFTTYVQYQHPYTITTPTFYNITSSSTNNVDFAVSFIPNIYDIITTLTEYTPARPGFNSQNMVTLENMGTEESCGTLTVSFDSIFDYVSSTPPPDTLIGNNLIWNNICIPVMHSENFTIVLHTDSTTTIDSPYTIIANFASIHTDTTIYNNSDTITSIVVGSFDPNDKHVTPDGEIDNSAAAAEQEFEYTIRFQNTGTASAINIKITDELSNWLQLQTFDLLSSSHPCTVSLNEPRTIQFNFDNINLPDVNTDELGSHGFVKFKIRCRPELYYGGYVYNSASIFFDFNLPIVTNTVLTYTKAIVTNIPEYKKPANRIISADPNPASDHVVINVNYNGNEKLSLEISDTQGRVVLVQNETSSRNMFNLDISSLKAGTYMVKVSSKDFSSVEPLIVY